jgi:hypothetical protein
MIIKVATSAEEEAEESARIIPRPAITANPTNGWRGALSSFINRLLLSRPGKAASIAALRRQDTARNLEKLTSFRKAGCGEADSFPPSGKLIAAPVQI